jgi:hypothetical protein
MSSDVALRKFGADRRALIRARLRGARLLAVALSAIALAGCNCTTSRGVAVTRIAKADVSAGPQSRTPVPLPSRTLLTPQAEPDCKYTAGDSAADEQQKLDYERQCYRHAEMIARNRLRLLQGSVGETIRTFRRSQPSGS